MTIISYLTFYNFLKLALSCSVQCLVCGLSLQCHPGGVEVRFSSQLQSQFIVSS